MKIAVCLFGHLRTHKNCYKALKANLLNLYDCDVFMHTWSMIEHTTSTWHNEKMKKNISVENIKDKIIEIYNLKDIQMEEQEDKDLEYGNAIQQLSFQKETYHSIWGVNCLHHSIRSSYELCKKYSKQNNVKYDYILFIRPDILLYKNFIIEKFTDGLSEEELNNSFFYPSIVTWYGRTNDNRKLGGNDLIFFAKENVINDFLNNLHSVSDNFKKDTVYNRCLESYILDLIEKLGYKHWRLNYEMFKDFDILRNNQKVPYYYGPKFFEHYKKFELCEKGLKRFLSELGSIIYYAILRK